jgi:hypothetical protein
MWVCLVAQFGRLQPSRQFHGAQYLGAGLCPGRRYVGLVAQQRWLCAPHVQVTRWPFVRRVGHSPRPVWPVTVLPRQALPVKTARVLKISARAFKVLACRVGHQGYQIDAFGADLFITVDAHEPEARYLLVGSRSGSITLSGPGPGHVYRDGAGMGHARRAGSGTGCALRSGPGRGDAYKDGWGDGAAIRLGSGPGDAINHSTGVGNAWREGRGAGDAIRSGVGQGHAYRLDNGPGQALRDGQGDGDALNFGHGSGLSARLDTGAGKPWSMLGAMARIQTSCKPQACGGIGLAAAWRAA